LFHACERWLARRTTFLFTGNFALDDNETSRWNRPRVSNTNCIFRWLYERCAECETTNFRHVDGFWTSWRGRQSCLRRSAKQNRFCLCDESDEAIAPAQREIIAACGRELCVAGAAVAARPHLEGSAG